MHSPSKFRLASSPRIKLILLTPSRNSFAVVVVRLSFDSSAFDYDNQLEMRGETSALQWDERGH
jgi:hypothetical protein